MNDETLEFNKQLELDVLVNGLTEITEKYVNKFDRRKLTDVIIPEGVTRIERYAFYNCFSLRTVTLPTSVTSINCSAFYYCNVLTSFKIKSKTSAKATLDRVGYAICYALNVPLEKISVHVSEICYNRYVIIIRRLTND